MSEAQRDAYVEANLRNLVKVQRVSNSLAAALVKDNTKAARDALKLLNDPSLIRKWSADRTAAVLTRIEDFLLEFGTIYINAEAKNLAFLTAAPITVPKVSKATITTALKRPMHQGNLSVADGIARYRVNGITQVRGLVQRSIEEGLTIKQTRDELGNILIAQQRQLDTLARTSISATTNQMRDDLYAANSDIVDQLVWSSVFDSRTSDVCMGLSGKVFPLDKGPRPPAHFNCRSFMVPVLKDESARSVIQQQLPKPAVEPSSKYQKGDTKTKGGKVRKPRKGGPLKGTTTNSMTYESWIKKQPAQYQRDVLGKQAAEKLQRGVPLNKILRDRNENLNLTQYKNVLGEK